MKFFYLRKEETPGYASPGVMTAEAPIYDFVGLTGYTLIYFVFYISHSLPNR